MRNDAKPSYLRDELLQLFTDGDQFAHFMVEKCLDGVWFWDLENPENEFMDTRFWSVIGHDHTAKAHKASEWQDLIHPDDLETAIQNFEAHCADPQHPYDQIVRYKSAQGEWVHVRCRGFAIRDEDGTPKRMLGVHSDVTELMNAQLSLAEKEEALRASEEELDFIFNALPSRIWYKDDKNMILRANEAAAESSGTTTDVLNGASTWDLYPEIADKYYKDDMAVIESGEPLKGMIEPYTPKNGQIGWVKTDKIPIKTQSGDRKILVIADDVTEMKQTEQRLADMTESSRQFASIAAHDLRAPVRQSKILLEMLEEEIDEEGITFSEDGQYALEKISKNLNRMTKIIGDLHALSRLEAVKIRAETIDLNPLISRIVKDNKDTLKAVNANVHIDELINISGAPQLVEQAIVNLITNACKYGHNEGQLDLKISTRAVSEQQCRQIIVEDKGSGFDENQRERAFEPFTRLHHHEGDMSTGLGLAIVSRIMSAHGGTAYIDPSYTDGARTILEFPRR